MKLATTTVDFAGYTRSQAESVKYIAKAGFRYIDYSFQTDFEDRSGIYESESDGYCKKLRDQTESDGLRFVQAHSPLGKPLLENDDGKAFVEDTVRCVRACSLLGIDKLVVHSGYLPDISKEECFERNRRFFNVILAEAEKYGVYILVENFNKMHVENVYWIDNAPDLLALIKYVDHPLFHAVWDTGHANMQEMPQDEALRLLGKYVKALHVQDNNGKKDQHVAPFFGTLNVDSLMKGLKDVGYNGYFTFEANRFFLPGSKRRPFEQDGRLLDAPLGLRIKGEELLYNIGKTILSSYGCFEE